MSKKGRKRARTTMQQRRRWASKCNLLWVKFIVLENYCNCCITRDFEMGNFQIACMIAKVEDALNGVVDGLLVGKRQWAVVIRC